ncbi:MAG: hypothetical protein ABSH20_05580, partial [Tepidisphaeraceae bacterium]
SEHAPEKAADATPAKPADHVPSKSAEHGPTVPAEHAPAQPTTPASHSQDAHELIHDAASPPQAAAPTTQPTQATAEAPAASKSSRTLALAGLITGSAVLSVLLVHIVRTHR